MDNSMKKAFLLYTNLLPIIIGILLMSACCHTDSSKTTELLADVWFKYDEPVNGYNIKFHCRQAFDGVPNYFSMELFFENDSASINWPMSELIALERIWKEEYNDKDTITLHNTHKELGNPLLDYNNIVYFEDMNFDGEDELIICISPCHSSEFLSVLDCESFSVFCFSRDWVTPCNNNSFVREISNAQCRTTYKIDKTQKNITLTGYGSADSYTEKTFWFRDGFPYKLDYTHVINGEKYHHHIKLNDAEIDSIKNWR